MEINRILSILIALPITLAIFIFGNTIIINIGLTCIAMLCLYEYFNVFKEKAKPVKWVAYLSTLIILSFSFFEIQSIINAIPFITFGIIFILFMHVVFSNMKFDINDISITLFGIIYIVLPIMCISLIRQLNNGKIYMWVLFIAAWGTDTFAYLIGRKIGKHKISKISPKKSIEGAIAGVIGAIILNIIYIFICQKYINLNISYIYLTIMTLILSIVSQIGDFSASSIKRTTKVKDFGNLMPGHGGMLDRIDSVIMAAPFAYFLLLLI